jgi:hypothetical protein
MTEPHRQRPEPIAISPAGGPIPPISVSLAPPAADPGYPPGHAAAARRLLGWAARRDGRNDTLQEKH